MTAKAKRFQVAPGQISLLEVLSDDPLERLAAYWDEANRRWFGGKMEPVPIVAGLENTKRTMGTWWPARRQIQIRESLLDRINKPGMYGQVTDVLLHEMVHQYLDQHLREKEWGEPEHGPTFTAWCNKIGSKLGLAEVVARKPRGRDVPLSRYWPHCVRPDSKPMLRPKPDFLAAHLIEIVRYGVGTHGVDESFLAEFLQVSRATVHRKLCLLERWGHVTRRDGQFYARETAP
jgi:hypothetical protein